MHYQNAETVSNPEETQYLTNKQARENRGEELYEVVYPDKTPNGLRGLDLNNYNKRKASLELLKSVINCIYYTDSQIEIKYTLQYIEEQLNTHYTLTNIDFFLEKFSDIANKSKYTVDNCEVSKGLKDFLLPFKMESINEGNKKVMSLFTPKEKRSLKREGAVVNRTKREKKGIIYAELNQKERNPNGQTPLRNNSTLYAELKPESYKPVSKTLVLDSLLNSLSNTNLYEPNPNQHSKKTIEMHSSELFGNKPSLTPTNLKCEKETTEQDQKECLNKQAQAEDKRRQNFNEKTIYPNFYSILSKKLIEGSLTETSLKKQVNNLTNKKCLTNKKNNITCNKIITELTPTLCGPKPGFFTKKKNKRAYEVCKELVDNYYEEASKQATSKQATSEQGTSDA